MRILRALAACLLALALPVCVRPAHAAKPKADPPNYWVGTWTTSNIALNGAQMGLGTADKTLREIVHGSLGGPLVRVTLTNEFGTQPLVVGAVHIALAGPEGTLQLASANALTFHGKASITIPAGAVAVSDPAALNLPADSDLAISLFVPAQPLSFATLHGDSHTTSYLAPGNVVGEKTAWPAKAGWSASWTAWRGRGWSGTWHGSSPATATRSIARSRTSATAASWSVPPKAWTPCSTWRPRSR